MVMFRPAPADEAALKQFRDSPSGHRFRDTFNQRIGPNAHDPASPPGLLSQTPTALLASALGMSEDVLPRRAPDVDSATTGAPEQALEMRGASEDLQQMPVFFVPGFKLALPVQGHGVQFWPAFMSRVQLVSLLNRVHDGLAEGWLAMRNAHRWQQRKVVEARVLTLLRRARGFHGPVGTGGGPAAPTGASEGGGEICDDEEEDLEEPPEMHDLMDELKMGSGGGSGSGGVSAEFPYKRGLGGLGKSIELVTLGIVSIAGGAVCGLAECVDRVVLATPGGRTLLGLRPEFDIQACRLEQALSAARRWNGVCAPFMECDMLRRHRELEEQVNKIMAMLERSFVLAAGEGDRLDPAAAAAPPPAPANLDSQSAAAACKPQARLPEESGAAAQGSPPGAGSSSPARATPSHPSGEAADDHGGRSQLQSADVAAAGAEQRREAAPSPLSPSAAPGEVETEQFLPSMVAEHVRTSLRRMVTGAPPQLSMMQDLLAALRAVASGDAVQKAEQAPDKEQLHRISTGAAAETAGQQVVREQEAALRTFFSRFSHSSDSAALHTRLLSFVRDAVAERRDLLSNVIAAQQRGGAVNPATLEELRQQERSSRLRLMRSLLDIGDEVAAMGDGGELQSMRTTWLMSVNSLLAIDQASPLAPLLDSGVGGHVRIAHLKRVSSTLNAILSAGSHVLSALLRGHSLPPSLSQWRIEQSPSLTTLAAAASTALGSMHPAVAAYHTTPSAAELCLRQRRPRRVLGAAGKLPHTEGRVFRLNLDGFGPPPLYGALDELHRAAIELDVDQALGKCEHEMLQPQFAELEALGPRMRPEFRGLMLVGDVSNSGSSRPGSRGDAFCPSHFGYLLAP